MAQITIYLSDDIAEEVRRQAKRARKTMSAFVAEIIEARAKPPMWPDSLVAVLTTGGADLVEPDDPTPEDVEPLR